MSDERRVTDVVRVICTGGDAPHTPRELVSLHRRLGRPDLAVMCEMAGREEQARQHTEYVPGWFSAGSQRRFDLVAGLRRIKKTPARVSNDRDGRQAVWLPECPDCWRGGRVLGRPLPIQTLEKLADERGDVDISATPA